MHHPTKVRNPQCFTEVVQENRQKEIHDILPCRRFSKADPLYPLQMIIPCQRQMYQSNCFWTTTLLSTTHFSYILVLYNNYSKICWVSVSSADILSHKLIQRMHHFPFAYRPRLTSIMPWQSMSWVGNGANRTKLQGIPSCWEHSWVQGLVVSSSIHINKRCCPYRHT